MRSVLRVNRKRRRPRRQGRTEAGRVELPGYSGYSRRVLWVLTQGTLGTHAGYSGYSRRIIWVLIHLTQACGLTQARPHCAAVDGRHAPASMGGAAAATEARRPEAHLRRSMQVARVDGRLEEPRKGGGGLADQVESAGTAAAEGFGRPVRPETQGGSRCSAEGARPISVASPWAHP